MHHITAELFLQVNAGLTLSLNNYDKCVIIAAILSWPVILKAFKSRKNHVFTKKTPESCKLSGALFG